jgi:hypothetical protein
MKCKLAKSKSKLQNQKAAVEFCNLKLMVLADGATRLQEPLA